ncbi:MAG: hypothetical protein APF81_23305 [Desulfosporosinus sp. BRH_c37]|nr:MAG: hypothetical protein APF81_23305 [Desulfosporosinus sp. BRH_c37]
MGEPLDLSGLVVTGTYLDDSTQIEPIKATDVTGFDSTAPVESQTLTITFGGKTISYTIKVSKGDLKSIAITTPATKLKYKVGEPLDLSGLVVTGTYMDDSMQIEPVKATDVTGFDSTAPAASQTLTITIGGKTTSYTIAITKVELKSIAITTPATKQRYKVGEPLDLSGLVVTGTNMDESTQIEPVTEANVTGFDSKAPAASQTLTITIGGKTTSYTIVITKGDLKSIAITTPATKLMYKVGETLDLSGLVVTGTNIDDSTQIEPVTAADVTGFDSKAPAASQTLTITIGGKTTSYTIKVVELDTVKPVITLMGSQVVNLANGASYTDAGATAMDNVDGAITEHIVTTITNDMNTGSTLDTSVAGTYTYHYNVSDAAGNKADEVTRTVVVAAVPVIPPDTDRSAAIFGISGATAFTAGAAGGPAVIAITGVKMNDGTSVNASTTTLTGNVVVKIDSVVVTGANYTVDDAADTITLTQAYLNTLTAGAKHFTVEYTDVAHNVSQQISGNQTITIALNSDASLATVSGQNIVAGEEAGTTTEPKTASINVTNAVASVAAGDVLVTDAGAYSVFCGANSNFITPETGNVNLVAGGATHVYIIVIAADYTTVYYDVTINRASALNNSNLNLEAIMSAGGTVIDNTSAGPYSAGTTVSVTATANSGYIFESWTLDGNVVSTNATFDYIMSAEDTTLVANFKNSDGFAGGLGTTENPYQVATAAQLNNVRDYLDGSFQQIADIDLSDYDSNQVWVPIGNSGAPFVGEFDGNGYSISNLTISGNSNDVGLFGYIGQAQLNNIQLENVNISGHDNVGGLTGVLSRGTINNSHVSGNITGSHYYIGGLVGSNEGGTVDSCYTGGTVIGSYYVGGLVGKSTYGSTVISYVGLIDNCYTTTNVVGERYAGGIIGSMSYSTVSNSFALNPAVSSNYDSGRIVGSQGGQGILTNNYARYDMGGPFEDSSDKTLGGKDGEDLYGWEVSGGNVTRTAAIASSSVIDNVTANPNVVIELYMDTFKADGSEANSNNWSIDVGNTGLTVTSITRVDDNEINIQFNGTAGTGSITIQALASALTGNVNSNTWEMTVQDKVPPVMSIIGTPNSSTQLVLNFTEPLWNSVDGEISSFAEQFVNGDVSDLFMSLNATINSAQYLETGNLATITLSISAAQTGSLIAIDNSRTITDEAGNEMQLFSMEYDGSKWVQYTGDGDDDAASANTANLGQPYTKMIFPGDDEDWYKFSAEAGVTYTISTSNLTNELDTEMYLYDNPMNELAYNDDIEEDYSSQITWTAETSGDYYVEINSWGGIGNYDFSISEETAWNTGTVVLDKTNYVAGDTLTITLTDPDLDTDTGSQQTATVNMTTETVTTPVPVSLTETDDSTGIFTGSITIGSNAGQLNAQLGETITATYNDACGASGTAETVTAEAPMGYAIEGTISCGDGDPTADVNLTLVATLSADGTPKSYQTNITIPTGDEDGVSYNIVVPDGYYQLAYYIDGETPYVQDGYYSDSGVVYAPYGGIEVDSNKSDVDMILQEGSKISGTINLPSGTASADIPVKLCAEWMVNQFTSGINFVNKINIPSGSGSSNYTITVPQNDSVNYKVSYQTDFAGYLPYGYYSSSATPDSVDYGSATDVNETTGFSDIDMTLISGSTISGTVRLGCPASQDFTIRIVVCNSDSSVDDSTDVDIEAGQQTIGYTITVPFGTGYSICCFANGDLGYMSYMMYDNSEDGYDCSIGDLPGIDLYIPVAIDPESLNLLDSPMMVLSSNQDLLSVAWLEGDIPITPVAGAQGDATLTVIDCEYNIAKINVTVAADGSVSYTTIPYHSEGFSSQTNSTILNDEATLGFVATSASVDPGGIVAVSLNNPNGCIDITSVSGGQAMVTLSDGTSSANVYVVVGSDGSIIVIFMPHIINVTADILSQGVTWGTPQDCSSNDPSVATASIDTDNSSVDIKSVSPGQTTIYVSDESYSRAIIVKVAMDGSIRIMEIHLAMP